MELEQQYNGLIDNNLAIIDRERRQKEVALQEKEAALQAKKAADQTIITLIKQLSAMNMTIENTALMTSKTEQEIQQIIE